MTNYSEKLEELTEKREAIVKEIDDTIEEMKDKGELTFDMWLKYATKVDYSYLLGKEEAPLIRKFVESSDRYSTVYIEEIIGFYEDTLLNEEEQKEYECIKKELMQVNYGSMVIDW